MVIESRNAVDQYQDRFKESIKKMIPRHPTLKNTIWRHLY
jgi:hypothetical protein